MSLQERRIVIVGGGIGGLAAALLLARAGASVTLLERAPTPLAPGAGLLLASNGLSVMDAVGLGETLRAQGNPIHDVTVYDARGRSLVRMSVRDSGAGLDHVLAVRRSTVHRALLSALQRESRVRLVFGATATTAEPAGVVAFGVAGHQQQRLAADLVIGADGVHSLVRNAGEFGPSVTPGSTYVRGLVAASTGAIEGEYWTDLGLFGGAHVGDGLTYFYATATHVAKLLEARDLQGFRDAWCDTLPAAVPVMDQLESLDDLLVSTATRVDCTSWVDGRLVLLGDAAHAMAPTVGQGANSALVDAGVLAIELDRTDLDEALERYALRRRDAVRRVQDAADRVTRLSEMSGSLRVAIRDRAIRWATRSNTAALRQARALEQEDPAALRSQLSELVGRAAASR